MKAAANSNSGASTRSEGVAADAASNGNDSGASVKTKKSVVHNKHEHEHEHEQSSPKTDEAFAVGGKPDFFLTLVEGDIVQESDSISISDDVKKSSQFLQSSKATAAAAMKSGVSAGSLGSNHSAHLDEDEQISPQTDEGFAVGGRPDFFFDIAAGNRESESSSGDDKPYSIQKASKEAGIIQSVATAAVSVGSLGSNDSAHPDADEHERNSHLTDENVDVGDFDFLINAGSNLIHENESSSGDDKSYSIQKASKEASIQSVAAQTIRERVDYALPIATAEHGSVGNVSVEQPQSTSSNKEAVNMSSNQMPNLNTLTLGLENDDESDRGGINEDKDVASGSIILCSCSVCCGKERQKTSCLFA
eukprot:scaffold37760_cov116-Skeletonema_marinoi.AAC.1